MKKFCLPLLFLIFLADINAHAYSPEGFSKFIRQTKSLARSQGVSNKTIEESFRNMKFNYKVVAQDNKQPERKTAGTATIKTAGFQKYKAKIVTDSRVAEGKKLLEANYDMLEKIERTYGVEKEVLVALWGVESNYGRVEGNFNLIQSLASLAYEGRRREFFTTELINALKIIDQKQIHAKDFKGSWAGAFGQVQFMPSTFLKYAVDFDGDGRKDLWNNKFDALASAANYLHNIGWEHGMGWGGKRVILTKNINHQYLNKEYKLSYIKWREQGVKLYNGGNLPNLPNLASVIDPDGNEVGSFKEVYIVSDNFRRIMEWNRSTYFATSIGLIADSIKR